MAMASQPSSASSESFNCYEYGIVCGCDLPVKLDTSHSAKNPNRRFLRCPKSMGFQCKFFKWLDPPHPLDVRALPKVDIALERQKMNLWIGECAWLTQYHEDDRMKIRELDEKLDELKNVKKKMKKELMLYRIVICMLCTLLFAVILG